MFKQILVPVDGSPAALKAVEKACGLAKQFDSAVTLVFVIDPYPFAGIGVDYAYGQTEYLAAAKAEAAEAIRLAAGVAQAGGISPVTKIVESRVVDEGILEVAQATAADLIVMGSHGRRGIEKMLLGSVTRRVLSHTAITVMVVRG